MDDLPVFNVQDYGAVPLEKGGTEDANQAAIQAALRDAFNAGGGCIFFPAGNYGRAAQVLDVDS